MNLIYWDIDGTLIKTSRAGLYAISEAAEALWGQAVNFDSIPTAGMTDNFICREVIKAIADREPSNEEVAELCRYYETLLLEHLRSRVGIVLPSVRETLAALKECDDCRLLLLTGNSRKGAEIKLEHFGIAHYFDFSRSAFAAEHYRRADIARSALTVAESSWGRQEQHNFFVIGDTPNDIDCGKSIGAYTVGIATGAYTTAQLEDCQPWWAVDVLPAAAEFVEKIKAIAAKSNS